MSLFAQLDQYFNRLCCGLWLAACLQLGETLCITRKATVTTYCSKLAIFVAVLLVPTRALAAPIVVSGNSTGTNATAGGTLVLDYTGTPDTLTLVLTNTSPFDARITAVGFDLLPGAADKTGLDGFSGNVVSGFTFADDNLGNVPQFGSAVLDFGWITGTNFSGGSPNAGLAPGESLTFIAAGPFFVALSDSILANALFVRFQRVAGDGSDVGTVTGSGGSGGTGGQTVPEPASFLMLGGALAVMALRRPFKRT